MTLHRNPGPTRSDPHFFVVIALAAARGKSISKPKIETIRNRVRQVRKSRSTLVGSNNEIRIVRVVYSQFRGPENTRFILIVRNFQQCCNKVLVAGFTQLKPRGLIKMLYRLANNEATFSTNGNNNRIFNLLRFNEPQNFGPEILAPIRPAQPAARYRATSQVNPLDPGGVDINFPKRNWFNHSRDATRIKF